MRCTAMTILLVAAAGTPVALGQVIQEDTDTKTPPNQPQTARQRTGSLVFMHSEDLLGTDVQNAATGEDLGQITDVIMTAQRGKVKCYLVSAGGFLGIGDELIAISPQSLNFDPVDEAFACAATEEQLEEMPSFDADEWPNLHEEEWTDALTPYPDIEEDDDELFDDDDIDEDDTIHDDDAYDDELAPQPAAGGVALIRLSDVTGTEVKSDPATTQPREDAQPPDDPYEPSEDETYEEDPDVYEDDGLLDDDDLYDGWPVTLETTQEEIGEIQAVIVELTTHQIPFAIIAGGGVLGLGEETKVVPWEALTVQTETLVLNGITDEEFETLESVTKSEIETFNTAQDVLTYYGPFDAVQPRQFNLDDELTMVPSGG